ncbi:hypothetical protein MTO96_051541 [Rhipicephalus appendiculatus]
MEYVQSQSLLAEDGKIVQREPYAVYSNLANSLGETVVFDIEKDDDGTCYLYPPTMHFPHASFQSPEFKSDFIKAFEDYYDTAFQPKDDMFRSDVEEFFNIQKRLVEIYYQYTHFMNQPPQVEIRCLDALEYILRPYYIDFLRRIHVFQYADIHPMVQVQAEKALKKLIEYISIELRRSILDDDDVIQAKTMLQEVRFKLVYPWKLADRVPHPLADGLNGLTVTSGQNAFASFRKLISLGFQDLFNYRSKWPLQTFAHEPVYVHHQNTLYVPYSVFAWAYMDKSSKLPFSLPVYGFKIVRELFKGQWWVTQPTGTLPKYQKVQQCVEKLETQYGVENSVETYETIAELATASLLHDVRNNSLFVPAMSWILDSVFLRCHLKQRFNEIAIVTANETNHLKIRSLRSY